MELLEDEKVYTPEEDQYEFDKYQRAKGKVKEIKKFYTHLVTYMVVGGFFFAINMLTSPFDLWFYWPMLGWGIGLALHAWKTFSTYHLFTRDWEERQIQQIMDKD